METITVSRKELEKLMRETFIDVLTNRKDLIEEAVIEAFEDIGLGMAIEEGRTGEYVDAEGFIQKLDSKIKGSRGRGFKGSIVRHFAAL
jgi:lipoate-protein ligase B